MSEKIEKEFDRDHREHTLVVEGRNAVLEAFRSGKPIDKVFVLDGCQDGPIRTIIREAKKHDTIINFVNKDRLNQISTTVIRVGLTPCSEMVLGKRLTGRPDTVCDKQDRKCAKGAPRKGGEIQYL